MNRREHLVDFRWAEARHRRVGPHAARVRPGVSVAHALEVLSRRERDCFAPVADREDRDFFAFEQLLDHERVAASARSLQPRVELFLRSAHEDAFPCREPVDLDDTRRAGNGETLGRRYAGRGHYVLGEALRALDSGGSRSRAEDGDARVPKLIRNARDERRLGADDD